MATNINSEGMHADMSGMDRLDALLEKTFQRLRTDENMQKQWEQGTNGTLADFDGWFEPVVRQELNKALATIRQTLVEAARSAGADLSSAAVSRRSYKNRLMGNVNILGNRKRISSKSRPYPPATGGASGIRRPRTVSARTKQLYGYAPVDRAFILRFLESGTDVRVAKPEGPTGKGSKATYGNRGSIGARSFFGRADADARQAAEEMGTTLVNYVEKWLEDTFNNS